MIGGEIDIERRIPPLLLAATAAAGLSACNMVTPVVSSAPPPSRPSISSPSGPSAESRKMARYYSNVQADLLARGLMRADGGGPDTPFSRRQLVEDFVKIALYDEYVAHNGSLMARQTESRLRRWEEPVRMGITYGDTIRPDQRRKTSAEISGFARRLSRITGLPISMTSPEAANFQILVLNEDERRNFGQRLRQMVPGIEPMALRAITGMPRSTFCQVFAFSRGNSSTYSQAVAVIRGEHPDALRLSCIHEELAQGLGLANDSPAARPSIFNDDEEFARLTYHDELLLKMLYDPRLRPGMKEAEARPILRRIASELMGGAS
ncbi:MAG: DUF2927 domain-containing protein [Paracoccaceae bacterium]